MAEKIKSIFDGQKQPRNVTGYMLSRGVADYSDLYQFNLFETGYGFLIVLEIPRFLKELALQSDEYAALINSYKHILEYDFKSLDGIQDIDSDPNQISDGINDLAVITKVNEQSNTQFSLRYYERSGSIITKVNELYLRCIKDPRTQVKTYGGLLKPGVLSGSFKNSPIDAGYENEIFSFLYFVTDNTAREIEKAYLLTSCQPTSAQASIYNVTKGEINFEEISYSFNGYPITGPAVTKKAQEFLDWIRERTTFEESRFGYAALNRMSTAESRSGDEPKSALATSFTNTYY